MLEAQTTGHTPPTPTTIATRTAIGAKTGAQERHLDPAIRRRESPKGDSTVNAATATTAAPPAHNGQTADNKSTRAAVFNGHGAPDTAPGPTLTGKAHHGDKNHAARGGGHRRTGTTATPGP